MIKFIFSNSFIRSRIDNFLYLALVETRYSVLSLKYIKKGLEKNKRSFKR